MYRYYIAAALVVSFPGALEAADTSTKPPASDVQLSKPERRENGQIAFFLTPVNCLEATVTVNAQLQGFKPSHPLPWTFVLGGKAEQFDLAPADTQRGSTRFEVMFQWRAGGMAAKHDPSVLYRLPYPPERHWIVSQGNFGRLSHGTGSGDEYAIDWGMPAGSPVCAARAGRVIASKQDSNVNGRGLEAEANYLLLRHADGTCGEYLHLELDGVDVKLGQEVEAGQLIGRSGNTGNSSEPHLHFGVFTNRDALARISIPIRWHTRRGTIDRLIEGRKY